MAISIRVEQLIGWTRVDDELVVWEPPHGVLNYRDTPLLAGVDPYDDTFFNRQQVEMQLPREIAYLRRQLQSEDHLEMLNALSRAAALVSMKPHRFLRFVGD